MRYRIAGAGESNTLHIVTGAVCIRSVTAAGGTPNLASMLHLEVHPVARNKAVALSDIRPGTCILREVALASILLPAEKGRRCDACFRSSSGLKRCSGCASYWYCSAECQGVHWTLMHRQICKKYARFTASSSFQVLSEHEKMDAVLLSHLVAQIGNLTSALHDTTSPVAVFLSLLPGPTSNVHIQPICAIPSSTGDILNDLYTRFGNNNFAIQSHLDTIGHGIFPNASRSFNHSCMPNAAARYQFVQGSQATMEIVALRDISAGEEICVTYLDPALLQTRQRVFELTYGFVCLCQSCQDLHRLGLLPEPPGDEEGIMKLGKALQQYIGLDNDVGPSLPYKTFGSLPEWLLPVLQESYITSLSEIFSRTSHEGDYSRANETGMMLLALYLLIYPQNYPQIGIHLLEMAKTHWNQLVTSQFDQVKERTVKEKIQNLLRHACGILNVLGPEGDAQGRLEEIDVLQGLLDQPNPLN